MADRTTTINSAEALKQFVTAINHHDTNAIAALMTTGHIFVDSVGNRVHGAACMEAGWRSYFGMCPDYWIRTDHVKEVSMAVHFSTDEVAVAGDLAYERGTYTLKITDKASGRVLQDVKNKHLHILKRQPDGTWKTWRMMVSSAEPAKGQK